MNWANFFMTIGWGGLLTAGIGALCYDDAGKKVRVWVPIVLAVSILSLAIAVSI